MEFQEFEKLPEPAKSTVLFSEIRETRGQLAALPAQVARELSGQFQTKAGCEKTLAECRGASVPWGKLIAGLLVALAAALTAYSQSAVAISAPPAAQVAPR
jgi:hypothetical protein